MTTNKYLLNENLTKEFFIYLNPKDLAVASQVNKKFNKVSNCFTNVWREECNNYFCSAYEHNQ
jgi:hypothetical protein